MWTTRMGVVALMALSAGCAPAHSSPGSPAPKQATAPGAASESSATRTSVEIDNQNLDDMNIYLVNGGARLLLGVAPGLSRTTLVIPAGSVTSWQVRLLADPIGGSPSIHTPKLLVAPGQSVYWTIGSDPASSFASAG